MTKQQQAKKVYWDLIRKAIAREYNGTPLTKKNFVEKHHAIPKEFLKKGEIIPNNTVKLTPREHVLAHKLLKRADIQKGAAWNCGDTTKQAAKRVLSRENGKCLSIFGKDMEIANKVKVIVGSSAGNKAATTVLLKMIDEGILHVDKKRL